MFNSKKELNISNLCYLSSVSVLKPSFQLMCDKNMSKDINNNFANIPNKRGLKIQLMVPNAVLGSGWICILNFMCHLAHVSEQTRRKITKRQTFVAINYVMTQHSAKKYKLGQSGWAYTVLNHWQNVGRRTCNNLLVDAVMFILSIMLRYVGPGNFQNFTYKTQSTFMSLFLPSCLPA